jgi:ATP-dependent Clp protease adaptor protein ClpS
MTTATLPGTSTVTVVKPELSWHVLLYNDDVHAFEDVILWVQKAAGCTLDEAIAITIEAHTQGRAVAFRGDKTDCERVCGALRSHGLQAEIDSAGDR